MGYLCFRNEKSYKDILSEFDSLLSEYVLDKIRSELSEKDRMVISGIAKKGLIDTKEYGNIKLTLPRFKEFSRRKMLVED